MVYAAMYTKDIDRSIRKVDQSTKNVSQYKGYYAKDKDQSIRKESRSARNIGWYKGYRLAR